MAEKKEVVFAERSKEMFLEFQEVYTSWDCYSSGEQRLPSQHNYTWRKYAEWTSARSSERLLLLLENQSIIGYVLVYFEKFLEDSPLIGEIFILPEKRRKGNGRFLISELKRLMKLYDCSSIECFSECDEFWLSIGFNKQDESYFSSPL